MAKKLGVAALAFLMLGPSLLLLAIGVLVNPAANAACTTTGGGVQVTAVPESLTVTTKDGTTFTLNHQQLTHAATIITVGSTIDGVSRDGLQIEVRVLGFLGHSSIPPLASGAPSVKCGLILLSNMDSAEPMAMCMSRYL